MFFDISPSVKKWSEHDVFCTYSHDVGADVGDGDSEGGRRQCYFDFETCFAPQRRALFRHLNFQK